MNERVMVTGIGAVTPLGPNFPATWQRLVAGEDAAVPVTLFDVTGCRCKQAATAQLPDLPDFTPKKLSRLSRTSRLALPAAQEALADARLLDDRGRSRLARLGAASPLGILTETGFQTSSAAELFCSATAKEDSPWAKPMPSPAAPFRRSAATATPTSSSSHPAA